MPPITQDAKLDQILAQQAEQGRQIGQVLAQVSEQGQQISRLTALVDGNKDLGYVGMRERIKTVETTMEGLDGKIGAVDGKVDTVAQGIEKEREAIRNRIIGLAVGWGLAASIGGAGVVEVLKLFVRGGL